MGGGFNDRKGIKTGDKIGNKNTEFTTPAIEKRKSAFVGGSTYNGRTKI